MRVALLVAAAAALSCTTYEFEPVTPSAFIHDEINLDVSPKKPPNVALVVDKSGSMDQPMDASLASCGSCGQSKSNLCNTATCPTRWSELQRATNDVLPNAGGDVRFGLVTFPSDAVCGAPGTMRAVVPNADDAPTLITAAQNVNGIIQGIQSSGAVGSDNGTGGGTPTARGLQVLENDPQMLANDAQRKSVAILLTDGLPNCNANNPNDYTNPAACQCTLADCSSYPRQGCLDEDATVAEIRTLRAKGIQTVVIGFGAEATTGPAPAVLRAMAEAGGFERKCQLQSDCAPGDMCSGNVCSTGLYLPTNGTDLAKALKEIAQGPDACKATLNGPVQDPQNVVVKVNGVTRPSSEWTLSGSELTFTGETCTLLTNATPSAPANLKVTAVQPL